jgi:trigger factor
LKIETQPTENHQVKVTAEFETELFEEYKRRAAKKIAKQAKVPGFRPGKAPYNVIVRMYGEGAVQEEAVELFIDDQYPKVLSEAAIEPGGPGALEDIKSFNPPTFTFLIPLQPEIDLGNYKDVRFEFAPEETTEEDVNDFLTNLQRNYATAEPVERPSEEGDLIYYKLSGVDTKAEEGDPQLLEETPAQKIIGEETSQDTWPFVGFSKELIGLKAGEEKKIVHKFKKEEGDEEFKGKKVEFTVVVDSVKAMNLPELNDDFAKTLGEFEDFESLKSVVREQLENQKKSDYEEKYYTDLLEKIAEQATVKYPPQMVEEEIEHVIHNLEHDLQHQNLDFDTYLKLMNLERDKYIEETIRPAAEKRLINSLIIESIAKEEKVEIAKEDVEGIMNDTVQMLQNMPENKGKKGKLSNETVNNVAYNAMTRLYNQRTLERLKAIANGELDKKEETAEETTQPETEEAEPVEEKPSEEASENPAKE